MKPRRYSRGGAQVKPVAIPIFAYGTGRVVEETRSYIVPFFAAAFTYIVALLTQRKDPTRSRQILERIPAGRWGAPRDIAGAAVFLASPASDYINGRILAVDGGWLGR